MKIINIPQKTMTPLTDNKKEKHENENSCYLCNKSFNSNKKSKYYKNYKKVREHCHYTGQYIGAAHSICNLKYRIPNGIPVVFHNGSTSDYHFVIRKLAKELEGYFECLGENTKKIYYLFCTN